MIKLFNKDKSKNVLITFLVKNSWQPLQFKRSYMRISTLFSNSFTLSRVSFNPHYIHISKRFMGKGPNIKPSLPEVSKPPLNPNNIRPKSPESFSIQSNKHPTNDNSHLSPPKSSALPKNLELTSSKPLSNFSPLGKNWQPSSTQSNTETYDPNKSSFLQELKKNIIAHNTPSITTLNAPSKITVPQPGKSYPLMITDGSEYHKSSSITTTNPPDKISSNTTSFSNQEPSSNINVPELDNIAEHLLLVTSGTLIPISASIANDPIKTYAIFQELSQERIDYMYRPSIENKLNLLYHYGLAKKEDNDFKLTKAFYRYYENKTYQEFKDIAIPSGLLVQFKPEQVILDITSLETEVLLGNQQHIVEIFSLSTDTFIAWAYYTSEKTNIQLSIKQPFGYQKEQPQYLHILKPFIVSKDQINPLPKETAEHIKTYMTEERKNLLKEIFITNTLPQLKNPINLYDGHGLTEDHLQEVIQTFEKAQKEKADKYFKNQYKKILNQQGTKGVEEWLVNIKQGEPHVYPHLIENINTFNKKQNISQTYGNT